MCSDMVPIEESINSSFANLVTIFENNDLDLVISLADANAEKSLYHSSLKAMIGIIKAALTLDNDDMTKAKKSAQRCLKQCNKLRKKKFKKITNMLTKKNYGDLYSDLELHAELTYAMVTACKSILGLLKCHNMKKLAKIAYHIGVAVNVLAKCRDIFEKRTSWESPVSKANFEAGIRLERGVRNLIVSFLPPKLLKIVNFLGFKGVRDVAFTELNAVAYELPGIYSIAGELVLIFYWLYIEMHGCIGPANVDAMTKAVDKKIAQYPKSVLYKVAKTKIVQINGNLPEAIGHYQEIIEKENEMFHKVSHWELMWTNALMCNWDESIKYAQLLREKTLHSPAIVTFLEGIFRYTKGKLEGNPKLIDEAGALFEVVPTLRIRYLGKTMTLEKAVIVQSQRFFKTGKTMILPVLESLYNINYVYLLNNNPALADKWYKIVEDDMNEYNKDSANRDKYFIAMFYKGVLLKHMKKYAEAVECFKTIISEEKTIKEKERYVVPQASMELGLVALAQGNKEEAKEILDKTLKNYTKYLSENIVHIKSYAALRALGVSTDKTSDDAGEDVENIEGIDESSDSDDDD